MFPLGNTLVPHMLLPLRLFEPRYLALLEDCLAGSSEFGVVLIERGFEVGGGDTRMNVGCVAQVLESSDLDDGHKLVLAAGTRRLRVVEWLPDDPYPVAIVERLDEPPILDDASERVRELEVKLRRLFGLMSELGMDVGSFETELADDPVTATYQGLTLAPIGVLDRQNLLETDDPAHRLDDLLEALDEQTVVFQQQLAAG